ncbi:MAG: nitrilase, partial [Planctomycetes bacterium]|nr:nitrilase [Planctomycetota bacterium]
MTENVSKVQVAVMQASPVMYDREATIEKACRLIAEAAAGGAQLIAFPEAYVAGYPRGMTFGTAVGIRRPEGRRSWQRYWDNAVDVPGPATEALGAAAAKAGAYVTIGVMERDARFRGGRVYCTLLYFGPDGRLLGKHRKLQPVAAEKLLWGQGDGSTLT